MGFINNPRIVTDGLVLHLDAANMKSYDKYENLLTNSQLGTQVLNDYGAVTTSTDTTIANPFGGNDGVLKCTHTTNAAGGYFRWGRSLSLVSGSTYTFSYYFKNGTVSNPFDQNAFYIGTMINTYSPSFQEIRISINTNTPVGNGWYRQTLTFTPSYNQTYNVIFNQANNQTPIGSYYLYGFQLEEGSTVTDYYETTTTAKTRSTTWLDMSGNGRNATKGGSQSPSYPQFKNDNNGIGYFNFSGGILSENYSRFDVSSPQMSQMTAMAWYRPTVAGGHVFRMSNSDYQIGPDGWTAGTNFNDVKIAPNSNGPVVAANLNKWNFAAVSWDNQTAKGYLNGILQGQTTRSSPVDIQAGTLRIGTRNDVYFSHFVGDIAIVKVYDTCLSETEIKQNFNALRGRFGI